jgi:dGTPase
MAPNDQIHNRLTHSIEVASVGRSLGGRLALFLKARGELPAGRTAEDISQIVQAACLAHDIGNPPFGHGGEYAIRAWVQSHRCEMFGDGDAASDAVLRVDEGLQHDWLIFEGNAQGFRLAARGDNPQAAYMRLTYATLGAMVKYPWDSCDPRARQQQKFNVFSSEKQLFTEMAETMGLMQADGRVARHPLSFLSEAADDICYRIVDLEDAVEMKILKEDDVRPVFLTFLGAASSRLPLPVLRGQAISALVQATWSVFENDYAAIMAGRREEDLKSGLDRRMIEAIEQVGIFYDRIFADRGKISAELGAYEALGRILQTLAQATRRLAACQAYADTDFVTRRSLQLAWGQAYATEHQRQPYGWWLHQVMDYVSSLTDNYARQLAREIAGL